MTHRVSTISPRLVVRLAEAAAYDALEVVIELLVPDLEQLDAERARADRATLQREIFDTWSESVVERLRDLGGTLVDRAWINSTLKAVIPASSVAEFAADDKVERIDLPSEL